MGAFCAAATRWRKSTWEIGGGNPFQFNDEPTRSPGARAGMVVGKYKLLKPLGSGAMEQVWQAEDGAGGHMVALKCLPHQISDSQEATSQVRRTFQRVHTLQHRHICPIYDCNQDPVVGPYLVMKFLDGITLSQFAANYFN